MDYKKESFYRTLRELSKHIVSSNTLDALKNHCQDVLSVSKINYIVTPSQLFQALEECGKLSVNNTQYLADLLTTIGKPELVEILVYGSVNSIGEPVYGSSCYNHSGSQVHVNACVLL